MSDPVVISAAVEGVVDEAVVRRLVAHVGAVLGDVHGKQGKPHLRQRINGYNNAAQRAPWFVLVDLDRDANCAPLLRQQWLPGPASSLCFRVAVRKVEAWLMADAEALAAFLRVARSRLPDDPEALGDPKAELVNIARLSRCRNIRQDMVPRQASGRPVGPAYTSRLIEFVVHRWRPAEAAKRADSLSRAITCLERLVEIAQ